MITIKRAYDPPGDRDGERILVDRLWPRGVKKEAICISEWRREVSPTPGLRTWFGHDPARWDEFRRRYEDELSGPGMREPLETLAEKARHGRITLVYAARDEAHNHALVLRDYLDRLVDGTR